MKKPKAAGRHKFLFALLRSLFSWPFSLRFGAKIEKIKLSETPSVVLMNHNSNYDPIFAGIAVKDFMYFVASEHITRWGFFSKIIRFVFDPIIRVKGANEARAALEILRTLKSGFSVCIFAEGDRSFNGRTGDVLPSTGKLVKRSGAALVTYVFRGVYLTAPRWGKGIRRGVIKGELINAYSKEQIAKMSGGEINRVIANDLAVDAFADQRESGARYGNKRSRLAEGIEIALYTCPLCGSIGSIHSEGDRFFCPCGLNMRYTEYGLLEPAGDKSAEFRDILEWDIWQSSNLHERILETRGTDKEILGDGSQSLYEILPDGTEEIVSGRLSLYKDRIEFSGTDKKLTFPFEGIHDIDVTARMNLTFTDADGKNYEIQSGILRSAVKYREAFRFITNIPREKDGRVRETPGEHQ